MDQSHCLVCNLHTIHHLGRQFLVVAVATIHIRYVYHATNPLDLVEKL